MPTSLALPISYGTIPLSRLAIFINEIASFHSENPPPQKANHAIRRSDCSESKTSEREVSKERKTNVKKGELMKIAIVAGVAVILALPTLMLAQHSASLAEQKM
jgi:hypothetical protein